MLPPPDDSTCYARSQLSGQELQLYDSIVSTLQMGQTTLSARNVNSNRALEVTMLVLRDHPEFYWVAGEASHGGFNGKLKFTKHLSPDRQLETHVMGEFERLSSGLLSTCSDYTKAKSLYSAIASYASYDYESSSSVRHLVISHSLWGVFGEKKAVCDGFSSALQYLLQHVGIQAYRLTGTATSSMESGPHSWVLARIDGDYYHIDPTWASMVFEDVQGCRNPIDANFDYLCMTDRDIAETHMPCETIPMPMCNTRKANYYRQEGLLLQAWSKHELADILARQLNKGQTWLAIRAATPSILAHIEALCQDAKDMWDVIYLAEKRLGTEMATSRQYTYSINEQMGVIHLKLI